MKLYEKYKPSGIEWLGDIPEHWEVKRVKDVTKYVKTGTTPAASKGDFFTDGTEIWFTPSDINNGNIENSNRKVTISAFEERELTFFPENSVYLIGIGGTQGKVAICSIKASCNQQINVLVGSKVVFPRFLFYQLVVTGSTLLKWSNYTTMPIFTQSDTKYLVFILPQYSEQTAIANYLDTKTAAIDRKIELLTAKADKYKALRRSLINETVCRGLNPNVSLKDSGIEWIGMIPEHWEVKRLKEVDTIIMGQSPNSDDYNFELKGYPFLQGNAEFGSISPTPSTWCEVASKTVVINDILVSVRAPIGAVNIADVKYGIGRGLCAIRAKKSYYKFLYYYFVSQNSFLQSIGTGTTYIAISMKDITNLLIAFPPHTEQNAIAVYLDDKTAQIDAILTNIGEQITKLTQLRKTLINDVVTGKIKVTD